MTNIILYFVLYVLIGFFIVLQFHKRGNNDVDSLGSLIFFVLIMPLTSIFMLIVYIWSCEFVESLLNFCTGREDDYI